MQLNGLIHTFPKTVKLFLLFFLLALSFGFFTGFKFLKHTTKLSSTGIEQNYNGNQKLQKDGEEMLFKKSESDIMTIIHTHALSMSLIFFALGIILLTTSINAKLKLFLLIEPFISIIITFGGIWLMWKEVNWFKYIVMISGIFLTASFVIIVLIILWQLLISTKDNNKHIS